MTRLVGYVKTLGQLLEHAARSVSVLVTDVGRLGGACVVTASLPTRSASQAQVVHIRLVTSRGWIPMKPKVIPEVSARIQRDLPGRLG